MTSYEAIEPNPIVESKITAVGPDNVLTVRWRQSLAATQRAMVAPLNLVLVCGSAALEPLGDAVDPRVSTR